MTRNAFTHRPARSFAMDLQRSNAGAIAAAKKAKGVAVPGLSNHKGVKTPPDRGASSKV